MADDVTKTIVKLARYARSASGPVDTGFAANPTVTKSLQPAQQQSAGGFTDKIKAVAGQTARITGQAAKMAGNFVVNSAKDIVGAGVGATRTGAEALSQPTQQIMLGRAEKELDKKSQAIVQAYQTGKMSKDNYVKAQKELSAMYQNIGKESTKIAQGPSPQDRARDVAETAVNALSLGSVSLAKLGGKELAEQGLKKVTKELVDQSATKLEQQMLKSQAFRSLVERNIESNARRLASETTAQYIRREAAHVASSLLIKRPIFYQSNIGQAESLYKNILEGDYKGALTDSAWLGAQVIDGGPIGAALKYLGMAKTTVGKLALGKGSFIDEISSNIGDKNRLQIAKYITESGDKNAEKVFRLLQDSNLKITNNNVKLAAENFMRSYAHLDPAEITPKYLVEHAESYLKADTIKKDIAKKLVQAGKITQEEADRLVVVNIDRRLRNAIAKRALEANTPEEAWQAIVELSEMPNVSFGANSLFMNKVKNIVETAATKEEAAAAIKEIDAAATIRGIVPREDAKKIGAFGYTISQLDNVPAQKFADNVEDTAKLVSSAAKGSTDLFDEAINPQPQLAAIAGWLQTKGVSPQEATVLSNKKLGSYIADRVSKTEVGKVFGLVGKDDDARGGHAILSKLQQYIENKQPVRIPGAGRISAGKSAVTDIRQLTIREIQDALPMSKNGSVYKLTDSQARELRDAIIKGYRDIPLEFRALGDKIVDTLYDVNPVQKYYARAQSALRYTYNPFFRVQENVETKILSRVQSSNLIWNTPKQELDNAVQVLKKNGMFSGTLMGEAADEQVLGRLTANLTKGQQRDLAGLALDIAKQKGLSLDDAAKQFPEEISDALKVVVQYPSKGILASSLARTMNLAFFPMRYNAKVTTLAAKELAKQPAAVQKAVLHSMFTMKDWLQSDEGIRWQSENNDAIQIFNWLTPINSLQYTFKLLSGPDSVGDLGQLGGLPLGIITQFLDGQGIINLNRPYVQPKTGDVIPDTIPVTDRARAATALADVLNTMFTYPGRTMGLPGKEASIKKVIDKFIDTNGSDFEKRLDMNQLTPLQKRWVEIIKNGGKQEDIDTLYNAPAEGEFNWYTIPTIDLPQPVQPVSPVKQRKARGTKQKTVAQPMQL